mgnify:CR=1 FL=1|tara:strand:+ start:411 stop:620 length:210 start_codon:yes stop_codon:yes gene_type:complete
MKLTTKQEESLNKLKERYKNAAYVSEPYPLIGDSDCAMVDIEGFPTEVVGGVYSRCITYGIEKDGYCHT